MTESGPQRRRKNSGRRKPIPGLILLFATIYFVQGMAEPTEGLIAQPVRALLKSWGYSAAPIAGFGALLAIPWSLKPLYGLLTDFFPIAGTRRRSYLLITSSLSALGLACLYLMPIPAGAYSRLLLLLLVPTVGVAFSDVVVDALMIEKGQPLGLTGVLQSIQWAAMYGGSIVAGLAGGYLSQHGYQKKGFMICAVTMLATMLLALICVREEPQPAAKGRFRFAIQQLGTAARTPAVLAAAAFLFLWSFNPFSMSVLYLHMTQQLGMSEQFYGVTVSLLSVGAIAGSLLYGTYCRRVSMTWLIHLAITMGVVSTLSYCWVIDQNSAASVSVVVGFCYLTGCMVQYDLAAQACPVAAAGTTFALLMSFSNLSLSLSTALGGWLYEIWTDRWGATFAFNLLVVTGALSTSVCWLLMPLLRRASSAGDQDPSAG